MDEIITERVRKHREANRCYYQKNKERLLEKMKKYFMDNIEYKREYDRQYHASNAEKRRKYSSDYQRTNPEKRRTLYRERRARLKNVEGGHFTEKEWQDLLQRIGNKCLCCGSKENLVRDHVIPLGPPHSDEISNIQPLCMKCNSRKSKKTIDYR